MFSDSGGFGDPRSEPGTRNLPAKNLESHLCDHAADGGYVDGSVGLEKVAATSCLLEKFLTLWPFDHTPLEKSGLITPAGEAAALGGENKGVTGKPVGFGPAVYQGWKDALRARYRVYVGFGSPVTGRRNHKIDLRKGAIVPDNPFSAPTPPGPDRHSGCVLAQEFLQCLIFRPADKATRKNVPRDVVPRINLVIDQSKTSYSTLAEEERYRRT